MGIAERREREKQELRTRIVEAACDIVSEEGLDALSMRAIADRIEYSPGTIYLYFRDKDELLREMIGEGFRRLGESVREQLAEVGAEAGPGEHHRALGRAYVRFALGNTAYFRVMFELPTVAQVECPEQLEGGLDEPDPTWPLVVATVQRGMDQGEFSIPDAEQGALIAWGLVHGLTSLYLSGHMSATVSSHEQFLELVEGAMDSLRTGWAPRETGAPEGA